MSMIEVNIASGRGEHRKIPPNQQMTEKSVGHSDLSEEKGKLFPKGQNHTRNQINNLSKQYIAGTLEECVGQGISSSSEPVDNGISKMWFCVSKWSKALKQVVTSSMGLEIVHAASITARESEKPDLSLFL